MRVAEIRKLIIDKLLPLYGSEEAGAIALSYIREKLGVNLTGSSTLSWDEMNLVIPPDSFQVDLKQLSIGRPLQYVLGIQWFCGLPLNVNESVLIPRPETEELVYIIIKAHKDVALRIIDIGTGSGCIPVALKHALPQAAIIATDISVKALEVAKANALKHHTDINFIQDDILNTKLNKSERFDVIISNPPYIPLKDAGGLDINVRNFEPVSALFVPDDNPLLFYASISKFASERLNPLGVIYFEINAVYGQAVLNLLRADGFRNVTLVKDLSNNDRFVLAYSR